MKHLRWILYAVVGIAGAVAFVFAGVWLIQKAESVGPPEPVNSEPVVVQGRIAEGQRAYVALHPGRARDLSGVTWTIAEENSDPDQNGRFTLRADISGEFPQQFFVYASTYGFADACKFINLPTLRKVGERWVVAKTGKPLYLSIRFGTDAAPFPCY